MPLRSLTWALSHMTISSDCLCSCYLLCVTNHPENSVAWDNNVLLFLTVLQVDWAPLGNSHLGLLRTLQSMLVEDTVTKALPSLMPKWPTHMASSWFWLVFGRSPGAVNPPHGLGTLQHGNWVPRVSILRASSQRSRWEL